MSSIEPIIAIARKEDLASLTELAVRTFSETYAEHNTPEDMALYLKEHFSTDRIAADMAEEDSVFLLIWMAGPSGAKALAGYARLRRSDPGMSLSVPDCWELERFYITIEHHGTGLARRLMDACRLEASRRGFAAIWLGVWSKNKRAIRFYQKMGFRDEGGKNFVLGEDLQKDRVLVLALE